MHKFTCVCPCPTRQYSNSLVTSQKVPLTQHCWFFLFWAQIFTRGGGLCPLYPALASVKKYWKLLEIQAFSLKHECVLHTNTKTNPAHVTFFHPRPFSFHCNSIGVLRDHLMRFSGFMHIYHLYTVPNFGTIIFKTDCFIGLAPKVMLKCTVAQATVLSCGP